MRCQRCRERELDCVYEPTVPTPVHPPSSPLPATPKQMFFHSREPRPQVGTNHDYQLHPNVFSPFDQRHLGQEGSVHWSPSVSSSFGQPPAQDLNQPHYNGRWRAAVPPSLTVQSPLYNTHPSISQANGFAYQSPSDSTWSTSPYSTVGPRQVRSFLRFLRLTLTSDAFQCRLILHSTLAVAYAPG